MYDYENFLDVLFSIPSEIVYLEAEISKAGVTTREGMRSEGWMFGKADFSSIVQSYNLKILEVVDICDTSNLNYEKLPCYRSIYVLKHV